jgi:hypothetical protein
MTIPKSKLLNGSMHDVDWNIGEDVGGLLIRKDQEITSDFLDDLKDRRFASSQVREREYMHVASIPVVVVEKWINEGFNILSDKNITHADIVARLKREHLDGFLATNKRV